MSNFIHLHNHSDYSLLDGAVPIAKYVKEAQSYGMKHLGLSDHGSLFGALRFEQACHAAGINPVVGIEAYVAPESRLIKSPHGIKYYHMCLFCKDITGYKNLLELESRGYTEGFYYKPRIDDELLEQYHEGLIMSSACLAGEIPRKIVNGDYEGAKKKALYYKNLFQDDFYLEIMNHGIPEELTVIEGIKKLSKEIDVPIIATNDIHYLKKDHAQAQDILICIGTNKKLTDTNRMQMHAPEFYFKSPEEMEELFSDIPEALENTLKLAEKCDLTIPQPGPILPVYEIPEGFKNPDEYLIDIINKGLVDRYETITPEIRERADYETKIIVDMGFTGYFLIVWDFINWAKLQDIPVGPGRGSGAGSIVAYAMTITDVEPLKYDLLFERFLNPERVSMPDFDVDFCFERRGEVIDYVTEKYGRDQVGGICTFGTLKTKAVFKDVARVLDISFAESNELSKIIPEGKTPDGRKINMEVALEVEPKLKECYERGGIYKTLFDTCMILEGINRHVSTHACGKVIGKSKLTDYVPLFKDQKTGDINSEYTMDLLEPCGLVKMDFLGLKTLTLLKNTEKLVQKIKPDFRESQIPEYDKKTFKMLGEGKSTAVFQFESQGMQKILKDAQPDSLEDLIALNALYRPGPMQYIPQFIDSKMGRMPIKYPDPSLEEVLKPTYGVIVYQEQVMKVAQIIGGFSLGKADILRRAMGKKKVKEMDRMKVEFIKGALEIGHSEEHADEIFEMLKPFAGYGFNKSHAAAYSIVAYKTAFMKANYPAEFMAANLTNEISSPDTFNDYLNAAKEMKLKILPPDINKSEKFFTVVKGKIFYGLIGLKGIGSAAVDEILSVREEVKEFTSFIDFLEKIEFKSVNKKALEVMIKAGVFDNIDEHNRATLFHNMESALETVLKKKESSKYGQVSLFETCEDEVFPEISLEVVPDWPFMEILQYEKEILGFYVSGHPLDRFKKIWKKTVSLDLSKAETASSGKKYNLLGMISGLKVIQTKAGRKMAFAMIEDFNGSAEIVLFSKTVTKYEDILVNDAVLGIVGTLDTSRGKASFKVEEIRQPKEMSQSKTQEIHISVSPIDLPESQLVQFRDFLMDNKGPCMVFLHLERPGGQIVKIKVSPQLTITSENEILNEIKNYPGIVDVWKE